MDLPSISKTTAAFHFQAAMSFAVSVVATSVGICYLPASAWMRAFLALGLLYTVTSTFTLAKTVRDHQERASALSRVDQARLPKMLADYDPYHAG